MAVLPLCVCAAVGGEKRREAQEEYEINLMER